MGVSVRRRKGMAALAAAALLAVAGCGGGEDKGNKAPRGPFPPLAQTPSLPADAAVQRPFAADSVWNEEVPADAALDPASDRLSGAVADMARHGGSALSVYSYSVPVYAVGPDQPGVRVVPDVRNPPLHEAFADVPIPADARPAEGTDRHLVVIQPSTDTMWEFWKLRREADGWHCGYGGRMVDVSNNPGHFIDVVEGSEKVELPFWGATATGLPLLGGLITPDDLRNGNIDHALALALPRIRAGVLAEPAQRSDGKFDDPRSVPEGARFRIDPAVDLDSLGLPRPTLLIARAAQRYGMIVRDGSGKVAMFARDPVNLPSDPYPKLLDGLRPYQVLETFPWDSLQLVRMRLRAA